MEKVLHIVHCIDTEGPLKEDLDATFSRLKSIFGIDLPPSKQTLFELQQKKINLNGLEDIVAKTFSKELLKYNENWNDIDEMLDLALSESFRNKMVDDFGNGWAYSWHIMDHLSFHENPRHKDIGYGNIFNYYRKKIDETNSKRDEINWHFHPLSLKRNPLNSATSYLNNYDILLYIISRRIIDNEWFPVVNRPGFHVERPDSHLFLESWIPFDFANQRIDGSQDQPELRFGRFADWQRASLSWRGYNPDHYDYQKNGNCRRKIFRILNIGTRHRALTESHFHEAFKESLEFGSSIIAFADHDYRSLLPDVEEARRMLTITKKYYPEVKIKFSGAEQSVIESNYFENHDKVELSISLHGNRLNIEVVKGEIFGPQPFLAIKTKEGKYYHDNLDVVNPNKTWSYFFDHETLEIESISSIGVGTAGRYGKYSVKVIKI